MSQVMQTSCIVASAVILGAIGLLVWRKKKQSFVKVGKVSKLLFFPVKSMKAVEVKNGKCTKLGFEVNGLLDRSFMLLDAETKQAITQRQYPKMVLFSCHVAGKILTISAPSGEILEVSIKDSISPYDKIVDCLIFTDGVKAVDCGDEASEFFKTHLEIPHVRLVRQFSSLPKREYLKNSAFFKQLRKDNPAGFQDLAAFHVLSQASIDDLNSKLVDREISILNFRPNILVDGCGPYEEDSWDFMKFDSGVLLNNMILCTRCLMTTNEPTIGELHKIEPLATLRKYRIPKDPEMLKNTGSVPCFGLMFGVLKSGEIAVGDEIFASIGKQPAMQIK